MNEYGFNGEVWYDKETGEKKTKSQIQKDKGNKLLSVYNDYVSESAELGIKNTLGLTYVGTRESNTRSVKEGYQFNMIHTMDVILILKHGTLSPKEWAFVGAFSPCVQFPDNDLKIDNQYLNYGELGSILGYSRNTIGEIVNSLEEKEIVKVVKGGNRPPIIYFNPFLYAGGREVKNETCNMFVDSQYNPDVKKKRVKNKEGKQDINV